MTFARTRTGRALTLLLLFAGAPLALAVPTASAEEPTCQGLPATIIGTPYADTLYGTPGDDVVWLGGTELDDFYAATDEFDGGAGDDLVCQGGLGGVEVQTGEGDDEVRLEGGLPNLAQLDARGGPGADILVGPPGDNATLVGEDGDDVLTAGGGGGLLIGGAGADQITGGASNDRIWEGPGSDVIDAGGGHDDLRYSRSLNGSYPPSDFVPGPVQIDVATGTVQSGSDVDSVSGVECWTGTGMADTITGTSGADCLDGALGTGADTIDALEGDDQVSIYSGRVLGGPGDDAVNVIYPYDEPHDVDNDPVFTRVEVEAGPGDDVVRGHARHVETAGGSGRDTLDLPGYIFQSDRRPMFLIDVPDGLVTVQRNLEFKTRAEFSGFEAYLGSGGDDVFRGSGKDESFRGGEGDDRALGGRGRDILVGNRGRDLADGGPGRDLCSAERRVNCEGHA
jgi:Ca2+-binding RTX toxin-like protein